VLPILLLRDVHRKPHGFVGAEPILIRERHEYVSHCGSGMRVIGMRRVKPMGEK